MRFLKFTEDAEKMLNQLAHVALTKIGLDAYSHVKALETWLATHVQEIDEPAKTEEPPK